MKDIKHKKAVKMLCFLLVVLIAFGGTISYMTWKQNQNTESTVVYEGTVLSVDEHEFWLERKFDEGSDEVIVQVMEDTIFLDARTGFATQLISLQPGDFIRVYPGKTMTLSLPAITTGVMVFVGENEVEPSYTTIQRVSKENDIYTITATNGETYIVNEKTRLLPYRNKMIMTAHALKRGTKIAVWTTDEEDFTATRVVIFQR